MKPQKPQKTLALSGATSFTALWIAEAFNRAGWKVFGLCSKPREVYSGLKLKRLEKIQTLADIHFEIDSANGSMAEWIKSKGINLDVWVHHHHHMENFRSANYDSSQAALVGEAPLKEITCALFENNCKRIIFSGTYFEKEAITPYAQSKVRVWNNLQDLCSGKALLSKVVIPDPIGPLENQDRLIPQLIEMSLQRRSFELKAPSAVNDHLPVRALAKVYLQAAENLLADRKMICEPSGLITDNLSWVRKVQKELIENDLQTSPCLLVVGNATAPSYRNPVDQGVTFSWAEEWKHYATIYRESKDR